MARRPDHQAAPVSGGSWTGAVRTFPMPVEQGTVEGLCRAIGQAETSTVPPTFVVVADRFDPEFPRRPPLGRGWADGPPDTMLHVEQWIELRHPLRMGETVEVHRGPGRRWERQGRSGRLEFLEERTELVGADGTVRVVSGWVDVRTEASHRDLTTGASPTATVPLREDPSRVVGPRPGEVVVVEGLTVTQLVAYVGITGDLHPLHHDVDMARALGYPDVFAPGMLTMALTLRGAGELLGGAVPSRVTSRFRTQVWPGDSLLVSVSEAVAGEVAVRTRNQLDETVLETTLAPA